MCLYCVWSLQAPLALTALQNAQVLVLWRRINAVLKKLSFFKVSQKFSLTEDSGAGKVESAAWIKGHNADIIFFEGEKILFWSTWDYETESSLISLQQMTLFNPASQLT